MCSTGGATLIIRETIAKDKLNIANLMQTFENLLLQNYLTEFLAIALKKSLGICTCMKLKFVQVILDIPLK